MIVLWDIQLTPWMFVTSAMSLAINTSMNGINALPEFKQQKKKKVLSNPKRLLLNIEKFK